MSVLACNRTGCKNVMCHLLSHTYGYICTECFDELVKLGPYANIDLFMATRKGRVPFSDMRELAIERFEAEFSDGG